MRPSRLFGSSGVRGGQKESGFGSQPSLSDQIVLEGGTPSGFLFGRDMEEGKTVFASNINQTSVLQQSLPTPNLWSSPVSLTLAQTGWSCPPLPPAMGVTWSLPPPPGFLPMVGGLPPRGGEGWGGALPPTAEGDLPAAGALMRCTSCWAWGPLTPV